MIGRLDAPAMRLKCSTAMAGDCCQGEWRGREHEQRRGAAFFGHASDPRSLKAAISPDAINQRELSTDLVLGDIQHPALLLESAGGDLGRMGIDGNRGQVRNRSDVAQVFAEAFLVDRKVIEKRQQDRRNNAVGQVMGVAGHPGLSCGRLGSRTYIMPAQPMK